MQSNRITSAIIAFCVMLSGCSAQSTSQITKLRLPDTQYNEMLLGPDGSQSNDLTPEWSGSDAVKQRENLIGKESREITFQYAEQDYEAPYKLHAQHVIQSFTIGKDAYTLRTRTENPPDQQYQLYKNNTQIYESQMCYGSEPPIENIAMIDGEIAVTFHQGDCSSENRKSGDNWVAIYYRGKTINEQEHVQGASTLFDYKGKLGFVAKIDDKDYLYFNGKKASQPFDIIRTYTCCMLPQPYLKVYENGTLLFIGDRNHNRYLTQVDLNQHL